MSISIILSALLQASPMSVPPHPVDGYMTCIGASARGELNQAADISQVTAAAVQSCERFVDPAVKQMSRDGRSGYDHERYLRDYGLEFTDNQQSNRTRLVAAAKTLAIHVSGNVRDQTSK